jgi:hypothetical protein
MQASINCTNFAMDDEFIINFALTGDDIRHLFNHSASFDLPPAGYDGRGGVARRARVDCRP